MPESDFAKNNRTKCGLFARCNDCSRAYYEQNKERILATCKKWAQSNNDKVRAIKKRFQKSVKGREAAKRHYSNNIEKKRERLRTYKMKIRDKLVLQNREYRERNRDRCREWDRNQYHKNIEHSRLKMIRKAHERRKRRFNAEGIYTLEQWRAKLAYWGHQCAYCNKPLTLKSATIDHRTPLSRGGSNWIANLIPACLSCNSSKGSKTEGEFRKLLSCKKGYDIIQSAN